MTDYPSPHSPVRSTSRRLRSGERRAILLSVDLLLAGIAVAGGLLFWGLLDIANQLPSPGWTPTFHDFLQNRVDVWYYFLPFFWPLLLTDLYDVHVASNWRKVLSGIARAAVIGLVVYALVFFFSPKGSLTRWGLALFLAFATILTCLWRLLYIKIFTAPAFMRRMLVVGAGKAGKTLAQAYKGLRPPPFYLAGFIDDDPAKANAQIEGFPILGGSDRLLETVESEDISDLVIAITGEMSGGTFQTILDAQERGIEVTPMPTLYEELFRRVPVHHLESEWLVRSFVDAARVSGFYEIVKRTLDVLGGLTGLGICIALSPLVALVIMVDTGFPILYKQIRSGRGGRAYMIYKFRTMRQDAEQDGKVRLTQEKDERITRVGNFLRRTHIDELPQFWNVLRGEMSLVGPRAERPEWVAEFQKQIPFYRARLLVKPGVTGLAQVSYSYYATVEEMVIKLEYDLYYIKHRGLGMDLNIILRTVGQVFGFRGR
jgi:exopolysaccharide biosynthesis polyprenyl glycosylphosphotransferase